MKDKTEEINKRKINRMVYKAVNNRLNEIFFGGFGILGLSAICFYCVNKTFETCSVCSIILGTIGMFLAIISFCFFHGLGD